MPRPVVRLPTPPSAGTLARYGLTADEWLAICRRQRCVCPVCLKPFGDRKLVTDHEHVRGFKARKRRRPKKGKKGDGRTVLVRVMSRAERKDHVRGVLHAYCNGLVRVWLTLDRAKAIVAYLEAHAARKKRG